MSVYGWCQAVGLLVAAAFGTGLASFRALPARRVVWVFVAGAAGALVVGRIAKALGDLPSVMHEPALLFQCSVKGFDLLGAILGSATASALTARGLSLRILDLADSAAPGLGLAIAIQRWGCWSAGCCFGRPTSVPWGVSVEPYSKAHAAQMAAGQVEIFGSPLPIHPYQLYELGLGVLVGLMCFMVWRRGRPGTAFGVFLTLFFSLKLVLTFTRFPDSAGDPPWVHLTVYALLAVAGLVLIRRASHAIVHCSPNHAAA